MSVSVGRIDAAYEQYGVELLSFATTLVGPGDAQDVVSNALLRLLTSEVWEKARQPKSVLYKAVYFEGLSWLRATGRRRARESRWADMNTPAEQPELRFSPFADPEVTASLGALSAQQRAVIYLMYWRDLPIPEVADLLDVSEGSVRKQLARAKEKLRKEISR